MWLQNCLALRVMYLQEVAVELVHILAQAANHPLPSDDHPMRRITPGGLHLRGSLVGGLPEHGYSVLGHGLLWKGHYTWGKLLFHPMHAGIVAAEHRTHVPT